MKLRHNPASPFVRKVMVVAHELGLAGKDRTAGHRVVSPVTTNAALAGENPLMKIPAPVTDEGEVLFDSLVICEYLDSVAGGGKVSFRRRGKRALGGAAAAGAGRRHSRRADPLPLLDRCRGPRKSASQARTDGQMKSAASSLAALERCRIYPACTRSAGSPPPARLAISISASRTTAGAPGTRSSPNGTRPSRSFLRCRRRCRQRGDRVLGARRRETLVVPGELHLVVFPVAVADLLVHGERGGIALGGRRVDQLEIAVPVLAAHQHRLESDWAVHPHMRRQVVETDADPAVHRVVRRRAMHREFVMQRKFAGFERHRRRVALVERLNDRLTGAIDAVGETHRRVMVEARFAAPDSISIHPASRLASVSAIQAQTCSFGSSPKKAPS